MQYLHFALAFLLLLLASCAGIEKPPGEPGIDEGSGVFEVWRAETASQSAAISQILQQADRLIAEKEYATAEIVLNRAIRIDNRNASIWSRMAWLSVEQTHDRRAQDYISKSNSLTTDTDLLRFNWQLYYLASQNMGDAQGMHLAKNKLAAFP
jgi:Tfp pilus assembly protein PilF